jgi:hypothetical protein
VALLRAACLADRSPRTWSTAAGWGRPRGISGTTISKITGGEIQMTPAVAAALGLRREWRFFPVRAS